MPRLYHPETNSELLTVDVNLLPVDTEAYTGYIVAGYITPSMLWDTFARNPSVSFARSEDSSVVTVYRRVA